MKFIRLVAASILATCLSEVAFSQGSIQGTVSAAATGETLIGASVTYASGKGATTDIFGHYSIQVADGDYEIQVSYVGYAPKKLKVNVSGKPVILNVSLEGTELKEVEVVADVARSRETPVAFTNISAVKIEEEGANRDITMVLNSVPGVYATEQGGGMGDSRINMRGFDQRSIAVMVDGVPVNDMENGQVYWSNWDNLSEVTRTTQVQRGLGASKLAIPSVGGTINIMTKGIDSKKGGYVRQDIGNNAMFRTSAGYNSGRLKGGWGITLAANYKRGNGWVNQTDFEAWGYFLKIQKEFKNQLITLTVSGAPQVHGMRTTRLPIAHYSTDLARKLGVSQVAIDSALNVTPNASGANNFSNSEIGSRGPRFNPAQGFYIDENGTRHELNPVQNYYHKPQINLSHFWTPNEKFNWSNVAYVSIGRGGGVNFGKADGNSSTTSIIRDSVSGNANFTGFYNENRNTVDLLFDSLLTKSNHLLRASVNNHFWVGALSTLTYTPIKRLNIMGGLDLRTYRGSHFQEVRGLFGGDYTIRLNNELDPKPKGLGDPNLKARMVGEGDKINYYNDGLIRWLGAFAQAEYKGGNYTVFVNGSLSQTAYKRVDYFRKKDLVLADTLFQETLGWGDTINYKGNAYHMNSPEARYNTQDWRWFPGFTFKAGFNYNLNEHHNVFFNTGVLSIAPRYSQFYRNDNNIAYPDVKQQFVTAAEVGYGFRYRKHAMNVNAYYSVWTNKPPANFPTYDLDGDRYNIVMVGINTRHAGIEMDATGQLLPKLNYEVAASVADWIYTGSGLAYLFIQDTEQLVDTLRPSTEGVHVGDAAQIQGMIALRYEPFKRFFIKPKLNYFGKNFANFDPLNLREVTTEVGNDIVTIDNRFRESWRMPDYFFVELHMGYKFNIGKSLVSLNASLINVTNNLYITDAQTGINFDAATANVYVSQGFRYNFGLKITF